MKKLSFCFGVVFIFFFTTLASYGHAAIVYSNLGPNDSFSSRNGWSIGYPFGPNEGGQKIAFSFISPGNFFLTSIELAITDISSVGQDEFTIGVFQDNSGMPGSLLGSANGFAPENQYPNWLPTGLTSVVFNNSILLEKGNTYWVGVHPASPQPTDLGWVWNYLNEDLQSVKWGSNTPSEVLIGGNWEGSSLDIESAFRVNGAPVPIPAAAWLLGSGLISLVGTRKRFHKA